MIHFFTTIVLTALVGTTNATPMDIFKSLSASRAPTVSLSSASASNGSYDVNVKYESADCSGLPIILSAVSECDNAEYDDECIGSGYYSASGNPEDEVPYAYNQVRCVADPKEFADSVFGDQVYLKLDFYSDTECTEYDTTSIIVADGECHVYITMSFDGSDYGSTLGDSFRLTANANETFTYTYHEKSIDCSSDPTTYLLVTKEVLSTGSCESYTIKSTNMVLASDGNEASGSSSSGSAKMSVSASVGIMTMIMLIVGSVV